MKIKNILIAATLALGLAFSVSDGYVMAKPEKAIPFEVFVQDKVQFEKWEKEHIAHIKKIQELKDEKRIRNMEYKAFTHNPNAEPKLISKVAREIVMLDRQIKTLNQEFMEKTREKYGIDLYGLGFHKDFSPCFKPHYNQFGQPFAPAGDPAFGCPAFGGPAFDGPERRGPHDLPPHHIRKGVPPHEFYRDMPPFFDDEKPGREKPKKIKPEPEADL